MLGWIPVAFAGLVLIGFACRWLMGHAVRGPEDFAAAISARLIDCYAKLVHHLRVEGAEHIPKRLPGEPLIIVANHTAGIDPLLVQSALAFEPRWMMGADMMLPSAQSLWEFTRVIPVERFGEGDAAALRTALRHLADGGVIGVFPEGNIERPPRHILPFQAGVGLMIRRSGARVLPVLIDGTPQSDPAWASMWKTSRSVIRFLPVIDYARAGLGPAEIANDLQRRFIEASGWPISELTPKRVNGRIVLVGLDGRYQDDAATLTPHQNSLESPESAR